jgi:hypothetical protein
MTVVRQHSPLTMGWCIECHRRTNYVGGPNYDPKDPATFQVGTANYDVQRLRIKPDEVTQFVARHTKGDGHGDHGHDAHAGHGHGADDGHGHGAHAAHTGNEPIERPFGSHGAMPRDQQRKLDELIARYPQLKDVSAWRVVDLPASHRAIYGELITEAVAAAKRDDTYPANKKAAHELTAEDKAAQERFEWALLQQLSFHNSPTQCSTCHQ